MANPNFPGQGRGAQNYPGSGGNTPISFTPNVNRSKTKRWAEAKPASYGGEDWGDEDSEEEEEEPVPAPPPYLSQRTASSELSSRRLSGIVESPSGQTPSQKTLPFVRPADLYKRAQDNSPAASPITAPAQPVVAGSDAPQVGNASAPSDATGPPVGLPELKRMSGFGTDFLGGSGVSTSQQPPASPEKESTLHHNSSQASQESQGFRSVVHQAFDVPETPNSAAGTVSRTNSDGTSAISPIINRAADDRTPTIPEEPTESTPTDASNNIPNFVPGHRRDLSIPSPDNDPSKRPVVHDSEVPPAGHAEITAASATGQVQSPGQSLSNATSPTSAEKDFVAPLKFGSGQSGAEGYRGSVPTIIPHVGSTGNSPQDTDNDRLREEIMRSLSREGSQEPEPTSHPQGEDSNNDSVLPRYEETPGVQSGPIADAKEQPLVSGSNPDATSPRPLGSQGPYASTETPRQETLPAATTASPAAAFAGAEMPTKPRLARRFSWESNSSAGEPAPQPAEVQTSVDAVPVGEESGLAAQEPQPIVGDYFSQPVSEEAREAPNSDDEAPEAPAVEKPRLSIVPPVPEGGIPPPQIAGPVDGVSSQGEVPPAGNVASSSAEAKLKGFREILNYSAPDQRIQAFEDTRAQFAVLDTGLNRWVQLTVQAHPEHKDVVEQCQSLASSFPAGSPTRTRFPKLTSLGTLSANDGTPASASHMRKPSAHIGTIVNRTNVEQRGKEFLHTAGVFGGKAGETAKGLFAKGRSKFRPSGDKVSSPVVGARKSSQFTSPAEPSNASEEKSSFSLRNSVTFGNMSALKFGRNSAKEDSEPSGKRLKPSRSVDFLRLENFGNASEQASEAKKPVSSKADPLASQNMPAHPSMVGDLEQEMIAALGLSPVKQKADPIETAGSNSADPSKHAIQPFQESRSFSNGDIAKQHETREQKKPLQDQLQPPVLSIRPVVASTENTPATSPDNKAAPALPDVPAEDTFSDDLALAYRLREHMKQPSISTLGADERNAGEPSDTDPDGPPSPLIPPSNGHFGVTNNYDMKNDHGPQDSTNGSERPSEPSEKAEDGNENEIPPKVESLERPKTTSKTFTFPSTDNHTPEFEPVFPPNSAEILESKRRSISGLPISMPSMQSPLRNEVRYSPATRSSMRSFGSFGSFGKQSTNSKGMRPTTPSNDLSMPRVEAISTTSTGESTMGKLKGFGKRRRTSVSDLLTNIQGSLQGLQEKAQQPSDAQPKAKESQKKRTFSKISNLFNRPESPASDHQKNGRRVSKTKDDNQSMPFVFPNERDRVSSSRHGEALFSNPFIKPEADAPVRKSTSSSSRRSFEAETKPRASMHLPVSPSANSALLSGRFYSQIQSGESPLSPQEGQHTRSRSMPMTTIPGNQPLSPVAPSESEHSDSSKSQAHGREHKSFADEKFEEFQALQRLNGSKPEEVSAQESLPLPQVHSPAISPEPEQSRQLGDAEDRLTPEPASIPEQTVKSRKPIDSQLAPPGNERKNIAVSGSSAVSEHPFRDESLSLHRTSTPVELAIRNDDSSEEIVMSPTAYPGQEWTPMNYY